MTPESNVRMFPGVTEEEIDDLMRPTIEARTVLETALQADLESVIVLGYNGAGNLVLLSSIDGGPEFVWLLERARKKVMEAF